MNKSNSAYDKFVSVVILLIISFIAELILSAYSTGNRNFSTENELLTEVISYVSEAEFKSAEITTSNKGRLEFALIKGVDPAYIVLARSEHSGVHTAARDLQRDITKITGVTPNIVHSLKETAGRCVVIGSADCPEGKALLASVGVAVDDLAGKWELFKYRILNNVGGKEQVLAIAGSNPRGTIFGIYDFEQKHLDVDPLWFWADHEPPTRGELIFDDRINFSSLKEPTWKYRGWTLNDHPQLIEWMQTGLVQRARYGRYMFVIHPEVFERLYEAALRLKMNMFTWYFIDVDWKPDWEQLRAQVNRGLFITQHQMEGLGADAGFWNNYWDNHNPEGKPAEFSYLKYPQAFREFWTHYVKRLVEFSPHVVWELNQRGWADAPYSEPTLPDGGTNKQRAEILSTAITEQAKLVRELDANPDLQMMTTLYAEVGRFYDSGWIKLPPDVTTGFGDAGMSGMSYSKKFWTEARDPNRKYGQYFHTNYFGGGPQVAKCTPIDTYIKVNLDAMYERGDTQHMLLAMNTLRVQQIEIRGIAEMLWDYPAFNSREYLLRYCRENFGKEAAPKVAALYDEYYEKYPHVMRNDGFKTYPYYYKVLEPLFTIVANLLHIEAGNTDGLVFNYQYNKNIFQKGINDLGEVLEKAIALRPSIPENRRYFFDCEFVDAIKLIRGIYKLGIATNDAIIHLKNGDRAAALSALLDAQPLTKELNDGFKNHKSTDKWRYWYRSDTNKEFYKLYNLYQKARLHLETETMNAVTDINPQRRPYRGNVVMHDPVKTGDAVYGAQAERSAENTVRNGAMYSIIRSSLEDAFQINGVQSVTGKGQWIEKGTDYGKNYSFNLKGKATVYVAHQRDYIPEWLYRDGFQSTGHTIEVGYWGWPFRYQNRPPTKTHIFQVFSREYPEGEVILGKNMDIDANSIEINSRIGSDTETIYSQARFLPYIVFIKPSILVFENFRNTEFNSQPAGWNISENGGRISVVEISDYNAELRPSTFDLSTVPRYTPLDLRGLKFQTLSASSGASIAELKFKNSAEEDFVMDIRLKAGQNSHKTGITLVDSMGKPLLEVWMNEKGNISYRSDKGREEIISTYYADRWYNIKLRISTRKGFSAIEVQDDKLNVTISDNIKTGILSAPVDRVRLKHSEGKEGAWIIYNAFSAYIN